MPASYRIDSTNRLVRSRAWGVLTDADLRENREAMRRDPAFAPDLRQLYDFSAVTDLEITSAGVQSLRNESPFHQLAARAIVVSSEAAYGMARMFQIVSDRDVEHFRIFRDRASALAWLGVPAADDDAPPAP